MGIHRASQNAAPASIRLEAARMGRDLQVEDSATLALHPSTRARQRPLTCPARDLLTFGVVSADPAPGRVRTDLRPVLPLELYSSSRAGSPRHPFSATATPVNTYWHDQGLAHQYHTIAAILQQNYVRPHQVILEADIDHFGHPDAGPALVAIATPWVACARAQGVRTGAK